jgi:sugar-specific transcriptional regulator TrmB
VLITGLIWYNKISAAINNDIQITLNKRYPVVEGLWNKIAASKSEHNYSANEQGFTEYFNDLNQVNQKIINTLRDTHEEILILISTEETFLKIRNEIYQIMRIINELSIEARILIPESDKLQDLASELNKYSKISFQRLYKSFIIIYCRFKGYIRS